MQKNTRILFLCVANSARSQMAEALTRHMFGEGFEVQSAGSKPSQVNPFALEVLKEIGINHSQARSKSIEEADLNNIDLVITLCAEEICPVVPVGAEKLHWPLPDPAAVEGSRDATLAAFRKTRSALMGRLQKLRSALP